MAAVLALTCTDLNASHDGQPRVAHTRLAQALGYGSPHKLAHLIDRHRSALERFGVIPSTVDGIRVGRGRRTKILWTNKKQALFICTKAETPNATDITIQMVDVFDAFTAGKLHPPANDAGNLVYAANDAPQPALSVDLPEKARQVWAYLEPQLSPESWTPIALSDVAAGSGVRYSTISTVVNTLVDRKLLWRRKGPHQKAPNEYRLRVEGATRDAPKIAAAPPAGLVGLREGYAIVQGQLIDMTPPSYRKGEQVAVRLLSGTLALHTLLEDAPIHHFVRYHRLGWVGFVGLGIGHDGHMTTEHAMIIGRVVGPVLPPPADAG